MKLIKEGDLRQVNDQYLREEITFSRAAELLNEIANQRLSEIIKPRMHDLVNHLMDTRNVKIYKTNNWNTKQIVDACMKSHLRIEPNINP